MDAVRYLEETRRMCRFFLQVACAGCPALIDRQYCMFSDVIVNYRTKTTDAVKIVEEWSKEHPIKTRNSEFLKHYPNARVQEDGTVELCPKWIDPNFDMGSIKCHRTRCDRCKAEYWMQEVEL